MNKSTSILVITLLLLLKTSLSCAQQYETNSVVKLNVPGLLFGAASIGYEKAFNDHNSVVASASFGSVTIGGVKYTILGLAGEYRFYLSRNKQAPTGIYMAPGASLLFGRAKIKSDFLGSNENYSFNVYGPSIKGIMGYQWIWDSGLAVGINIGIKYLRLFGNDSEKNSWSGLGATLPAFGLAIGYGF